MSIADRTGVIYNPLADRWQRSKDMDVNYMVLAEKRPPPDACRPKVPRGFGAPTCANFDLQLLLCALVVIDTPTKMIAAPVQVSNW